MSPHRSWFRTGLAVLSASLISVSTAACAETDGIEESSDAVSVEQVLQEGAQTLLERQPASDAAVDALGVRQWSVHLVNDTKAGRVGALLLGTDARDQVAYAVVVGADASQAADERATVTYVRYGIDGVAPNQAFDEATKRLLAEETLRMSALLEAEPASIGVRANGQRSRLANARICAIPLAVGLLIGGGGYALGAAVMMAGGSANFGLALVGAVVASGAPVVGGATAVVGTGVAFAFEGWRNACKNAFTGR